MNDISLNDLDQFFSQYPISHYPKGRIFISPGEDPKGIFYLESGKVRKYDVTKFGEQVVMNVFKAPVFFPISWALNKTPNLYYFEALTPAKVRCVPTEAFVAYLKTNPRLVYALLKEVYAGIEDTQRRVVYLTRGGLRARLLFELLIEVRRSGVLQKDGSYIISVTTTELGQRAGLSRETISRELSKLFNYGDICRRKGRSIVVQDLHKLEEVLASSM